MILEKLEIKNYRGFSDENISFGKYTSLVGPNGSGKSTILMCSRIGQAGAAGPHKFLGAEYGEKGRLFVLPSESKRQILSRFPL